MKNSKGRTGSPDTAQATVVRSNDGEVCFRLRSTRHGLWVQRERWRKNPCARLVQSVLFCDVEGFARWCDADSVRFDYPVILSIVRREGGALLNAHEQPPAAERSREGH